MKARKIGLLLILGGLLCNSACEVEGGKRSTSSSLSSSIIMPSTSSSNDSSYNSTISSSSTSSSISVGLPQESQNFIDYVNSIIDEAKDAEAINNAFLMFDSLLEWDYPEVLDAYNRLCEYEEQYNITVSNREKIDLFIEKIVALPEEITLEDEYLIIRAEDSYSKLDENLKSDPEVIEGYNKMMAAREAYNALYDAAMAEKDAADVAEFLAFINSLPAVENLTYHHYFSIKDAIAKYDLLSDNAKNFEGVAEAYVKLCEAQTLIDVKDGTHLFDISVEHKGGNWEAILNIKAKDEAQKVSGVNKVHELMIYEDIAYLAEAHMLAWNSLPAYSSTKSDGTHLFAFTILKAYLVSSIYTASFIVETDTKEAYAVNYYFMVDGNFTCGGYTEISLYKQQLSAKFESFYQADYSEENWNNLISLRDEGLLALDESTTVEHARIIANQYYFEMSSISKIFGELPGLTVVDASSAQATMGSITDDNEGSSWQATSNVSEYVVIDLGDVYSIMGIKIIWEAANAKHYNVRVSNENANWNTAQTVYQYRNGVSGARTDELRFDEIECRYIKLELKTGSMSYGFRIFEVDVYSMNAPVLEAPEI